MSGIEDDQSYEVLPQRQPRERKRQRKDEELKQLKADESTPDAGLAPASETEVEPATSEESCPPETDTTKGDAPGQTENQEDEDQDLQKYRSGKVEGYNFECKLFPSRKICLLHGGLGCFPTAHCAQTL